MTLVADRVPPLPALWDNSNYEFLNHEVGHAVMAYYWNFPIIEVRIDRPEFGTEGYVILGEVDPSQLRNRLLVTMAGPIATGKRLRWPPDDLTPGDPALQSDQKNAALIVKRLGLTDVEWFESREIASEILALRRMIRASRALAWALFHREAIPGDEVYRICDEAVT